MAVCSSVEVNFDKSVRCWGREGFSLTQGTDNGGLAVAEDRDGYG